ncbi:hypothetical protein H3Z83_09480 [Tenacibaculum sp. S7007]|uniref:Uncharacterized protein n=1 Tax=Tenacibaculum pelagium TaxID=2759527 RepID=A0A839ARI2_9FLAO|nr:hypothetical protein [Tenacibaculum pelagium]MBA6156744.1 hypothetical protein [Tenacibaculum pelagium]
MLKNISNVGKVLKKQEQQSIKGGYNLGECPPQYNHQCFEGGPFYCNIHKLPICVELPHEN